MVVQCDLCENTPSNNDEIYYLIRTTNTGLDFGTGMVDYTVCGDCLTNMVDSKNKRNKIQSILRLENPMM